jgi:hypothetical protein
VYYWDEEEGMRSRRYGRKIQAVDLPIISDCVAVADLYRNSPQRVNYVVVRSENRVRVVQRRMQGELSHFHYPVVAARKTFLVLVPVPVSVFLSVVAVLAVVGGANDRMIAGRS